MTAKTNWQIDTAACTATYQINATEVLVIKFTQQGDGSYHARVAEGLCAYIMDRFSTDCWVLQQQASALATLVADASVAWAQAQN